MNTLVDEMKYEPLPCDGDERYHAHINDCCCVKLFPSETSGVFNFYIEDKDGENWYGTASPNGETIRSVNLKIYEEFIQRMLATMRRDIANHDVTLQ